MKIKLMTLLLMLFISCASCAADVQFPQNCRVRNVTYATPNVVLSGKLSGQPRLYYIYNASKQWLLLDHQVIPNPGVKAGWNSGLRPGRWSALVVVQQGFALSCHIIQANQHYVTRDCRQLIRVCSRDDAKLPQQNWGRTGAWVKENFVLSLKNAQL